MPELDTLFVATTTDDLHKVTWLSHDCFFDLDQAQWDEESRRFELPFGRGAERKRLFGITTSRPPWGYHCALAVSHVRGLEVADEAEIGTYDLNEVRYDERARTLVIESNIPLKIVLMVDELEVRVLTQQPPHSNEGGLSWYTDGVDVSVALLSALG